MFDRKEYQREYRYKNADKRREYQKKYYASEKERDKKRKRYLLLQEAKKEGMSVPEWIEENKRRKNREAQARYRESIRPLDNKVKVNPPPGGITEQEIKDTIQNQIGVLAELEAKLAREEDMNRLKRRHAPEPGAWQKMIKSQGDVLAEQIHDERVSEWWGLYRDEKKKNYAALQKLRAMSRSDCIRYNDLVEL